MQSEKGKRQKAKGLEPAKDFILHFAFCSLPFDFS
jgi:hypothetical protein